ncbi:hypothetical protein BESB_036500 [Besnoitia besnoiti]|uniref:Uncharacterized protein n=1 Tax=Besnoitia besnoiti TaxID=94643 RepID=A0A2A9MNF6_BESBE|nr:hypothetical protein BESB_036500 [Besnoitia besnoiti]PFH37192.1 hypothetical protein BESB_036500 [Besnoitia besnoiti]
MICVLLHFCEGASAQSRGSETPFNEFAGAVRILQDPRTGDPQQQENGYGAGRNTAYHEGSGHAGSAPIGSVTDEEEADSDEESVPLPVDRRQASLYRVPLDVIDTRHLPRTKTKKTGMKEVLFDLIPGAIAATLLGLVIASTKFRVISARKMTEERRDAQEEPPPYDN